MADAGLKMSFSENQSSSVKKSGALHNLKAYNVDSSIDTPGASPSQEQFSHNVDHTASISTPSLSSPPGLRQSSISPSRNLSAIPPLPIPESMDVQLRSTVQNAKRKFDVNKFNFGSEANLENIDDIRAKLEYIQASLNNIVDRSKSNNSYIKNFGIQLSEFNECFKKREIEENDLLTNTLFKEYSNEKFESLIIALNELSIKLLEPKNQNNNVDQFIELIKEFLSKNNNENIYQQLINKIDILNTFQNEKELKYNEKILELEEKILLQKNELELLKIKQNIEKEPILESKLKEYELKEELNSSIAEFTAKNTELQVKHMELKTLLQHKEEQVDQVSKILLSKVEELQNLKLKFKNLKSETEYYLISRPDRSSINHNMFELKSSHHQLLDGTGSSGSGYSSQPSSASGYTTTLAHSSKRNFTANDTILLKASHNLSPIDINTQSFSSSGLSVEKNKPLSNISPQKKKIHNEIDTNKENYNELT
ncbi:hypothetical protein PACTADRAFT_79861 [Pachysolen tannophilus NRRL Y-2460]|uniref:Uncharacterized protein n=1 Tax=Pachysolen tannophilus NRRL Y-2460 TaxID=669874 RepID=A0A1E4TVJ2_PACTA|nr:hypothetical protein PACTADRAFT_79861 [Pachysolen tannophilus NRRL Y-2460]